MTPYKYVYIICTNELVKLDLRTVQAESNIIEPDTNSFV